MELLAREKPVTSLRHPWRIALAELSGGYLVVTTSLPPYVSRVYIGQVP